MSVSGTLKWMFQLYDDGDESEVFKANGAHHMIEGLRKIADGVGDGAMDLVWSDSRSLAASTPETLDLAGGITDAYGNTVTFVTVKLLVIVNKNTTTSDDLSCGPAAANGFTGFWADDSDRSLINANGILVLWDPVGIAVTAGTGDDITITELGGANAVAYDILIGGDSA